MAKDGQPVYEFLQNAVDADGAQFLMFYKKDEAIENDIIMDKLTCGIAFISTHKEINQWKQNIVSFAKDNFISSGSSNVSILKE